MTQCEKVLQHMETHEDGITWLDAYREYGIAALHSRICDLRKDGYEIKGTWETVPNRYGEKCRVMRYTLCG